jgi:capsule polysaccharide modification protein KpsS
MTVYKNKKYCLLNTVKHWAYKNNVSEDTVNTRINRGYEYKEIYNKPLSWKETIKRSASSRTKYYYKGKPICELFPDKKDYSIIIHRINRYGWSIRDAVEKPILKRTKYYYKETPVQKLLDAPSYDRFIQRINKLHWSVKYALEQEGLV